VIRLACPLTVHITRLNVQTFAHSPHLPRLVSNSLAGLLYKGVGQIDQESDNQKLKPTCIWENVSFYGIVDNCIVQQPKHHARYHGIEVFHVRWLPYFPAMQESDEMAMPVVTA
jgi:hypothetical protein